MTAAVGPSYPGRGDEQVTAEREETKYLLEAAQLDGLAGELNRRIPQHRFTGDGSNRLPGAHHFVTTVYFDTPSRAHMRAASADVDHSVKIRAKEYYDLHPSLAELATDPGQIVRYQPWLWFELKRRDGTHTSKRRFRLPKSDVPAFFGEGRVTPQAQEGQSGLQEIVAYCAALDEPLQATCLVNYRRLSWQAPDATLRVTVDLGLAFYAPPADLWSRQHALLRTTLGAALAKEPRVVVEVKRRAALPTWLEGTLVAAGASPASFSKFLEAAKTVAGHG